MQALPHRERLHTDGFRKGLAEPATDEIEKTGERKSGGMEKPILQATPLGNEHGGQNRARDYHHCAARCLL